MHAPKVNTEAEESEAALQRLESLAMNIGGHPGNAFTVLRGLVEFSRIQMSISRSAETQTRKVIVLTWVIALLTVVLLLFTAYLSYDAYQKNHRDAQSHPSPTEQKGTDGSIPIPKT